MVDVTDATFEEEVLRRSSEVPVVVDLWAPWCGPCRTLGPIIEQVVDATEGAVALAKVNVDENPAIAASFQVQSIPAVFALKDGKVVDGFIGALPEAAVAEFVGRLAPAPSEADLLVDEGVPTAGSEEPLRQALELSPTTPGPSPPWPACSSPGARADEAMALLRRIPETPEHPAAAGRGPSGRPGGRRGRHRRRRPARRTARPGARRRRRPAGVPRPAGDPGARGPAHRRYRKALSARLF